jgi:hypothetical protein
MYKLYEIDRKRIAEQMSRLHKGKVISLEQRARLSLAMLGKKNKPRSEDHSRKLGLAHKGIPCPEHVKAAVKKAATGRIKSADEIAKIKNALTGRIFTENSKTLMSMQSKGRCWVSRDGVSKRIKREELNFYLALRFKLGRGN